LFNGALTIKVQSGPGFLAFYSQRQSEAVAPGFTASMLIGGAGNVLGVEQCTRKSRAGEYLSRAAEMRELARGTRFPEVQTRLLMMATGFERLADQVEKWESASLATAAD
jgi:hypothetical protein